MEKSFLFAILIFCAVFTNAQDVIIKNDSTKIQSKVIELTETTIIYKKWYSQDGPLYNFARNEVNMIIYANGQKEMIKPSVTGSSAESIANGQSTKPAKDEDKNKIVDKREKVKYKPNRITVELQSFQNFLADKKISHLSFGAESEIRVVKNIFNLGFGTTVNSTPENDIIPYSFLFSVYGSFYAPINRLFGNYKKQNKGLFLFAHPGCGWTFVAKYDESGNPKMTTSSGTYVWNIGIDYFIFKGFGFTFSTFEMKNYYGGIVYSF